MATLTPGDYLTIYANQGQRNAVVLAVIDGQALLEYDMPKGTTALRIVPTDDPDTTQYKRVAYANLPIKWVEAMADAGTLEQMDATPQGSGWLDRVKFMGRINEILAKRMVPNGR